MKAKFLTFFSLIGFTGVLSICNSWILQYQSYGGISPARTIFQICLLGFILYFLWKRSNQSYVLAVLYALGYAGLYGYELLQFFIFGNVQAQLPKSATIISVLLILATVAALTLFALDYLDYRKRRVPVDE